MTATSSWFVSIVLLLGLVIALHQLGVNPTTSLGVALRGIEQALGQPLALLR